MAEKNIEMQRKNADGTFDKYYPLTKATNVKMSDGSTAEEAIGKINEIKIRLYMEV